MDSPTEKPLRYKWLSVDQRGLPATMASAAIAGLLSRCVMHPLDTAKAIIQVQPKAQDRPGNFFTKSRTLQTLSFIWKVDRIQGFYRGFAITSALAVPATCLYFSTYEILKARLLAFSQNAKDLQKPAAELSFGAALFLDSICGFSAEAISCVFYLPMDVCKERLQVYSAMQPEKHQWKRPTLKDVVRMDGLRGLYRGYGATLLSFGPFSALFFTFNHHFSGVAQRLTGGDSSTPPSHFRRPLVDATVAGAAAGIAAFVTAPLDKVKLRLQVQMEGSASRKAPFYYRNFVHGLVSLFKAEGVSGCFGGVGARTMFHAGSMFMTFLFMQSARNVYCRHFEG